MGHWSHEGTGRLEWLEVCFTDLALAISISCFNILTFTQMDLHHRRHPYSRPGCSRVLVCHGLAGESHLCDARRERVGYRSVTGRQRRRGGRECLMEKRLVCDERLQSVAVRCLLPHAFTSALHAVHVLGTSLSRQPPSSDEKLTASSSHPSSKT
jgi:hypothetical protein